jgi:hypothetical protein
MYKRIRIRRDWIEEWGIQALSKSVQGNRMEQHPTRVLED